MPQDKRPDPEHQDTTWRVTFTRTVAVDVRSPDPQQAILYAEHRLEKEHRQRLAKITVRELHKAEPTS